MNFKLNKNIFKDLDYYLNTKKINNCKIKPPSIIKYNKNRIIVIGDIHGDIYALLYSLYKVDVINKYGKWVGKNTIVVQLGDQIDKGGRGLNNINLDNNPLEELEIIEFMHDLHFKALKHGGAVYNLIGNHELMNVLGDFSYVSENHLDGFRGNDIRKKLFKPGGPLAQKLACNTNGIIQIGNWIFVHAGLLPEHIEKYSIDDINNMVRNILLGNLKINELSIDDYNLIFGNDSLFWNRQYSLGKDCNKLNKTLNILNIGKNGGMIVGHTIQNTINSICDNKLWMVDVGMSNAFGNKQNKNDRIEVLEIINNGEIVRKI
jgi:hypothetical protein